MQRVYQKPVIEVDRFPFEDVITASSVDPDEGEWDPMFIIND